MISGISMFRDIIVITAMFLAMVLVWDKYPAVGLTMLGAVILSVIGFWLVHNLSDPRVKNALKAEVKLQWHNLVNLLGMGEWYKP